MNAPALDIVVFGLSITSSWGNGHATTYRGLVRELTSRGHQVTFLERDMPWYAGNRDLPKPPYGHTCLYSRFEDVKQRFTEAIAAADLVIVGSYVPDGVLIGDWVNRVANGVTAFYDIDTPVTVSKLERGDHEYLTPDLIPRYDLYLSFTGGPILEWLKREYGANRPRALYCCVDPDLYFPEDRERAYDLGYMGTYSEDRVPIMRELLLKPARQWPSGRFTVAGPQYPAKFAWPANVEHVKHLEPPLHREFYTSQRFTLNITRADMVRWGYSPSVRLFEAAACGTPIISDSWNGLEEIFSIGEEVLVARTAGDVLGYLRDLPQEEWRAIGERARQRVLQSHTAEQRAAELESQVLEVRAQAGAGPAQVQSRLADAGWAQGKER
jgi:spore maturation protein CgeB